ncbi:TrbC/VirB2 family protein [Hutsoniella sourekii]|uniref:TrbC/VirB2 family protein n=1 Tax=Hutsoniella sourekii TaxID=87650 RepID=UPI00047FAC5D|nr:TrbC/VirB2 family protein [Hutsoniella sourekii]
MNLINQLATLLQPKTVYASDLQGIVNDLTSNLTGQIQGIAVGVATMMLAGLGIWWMVADSQETSRIKGWAVRIIVGLIIVLAVTSIIGYFSDAAGGFS